ncbi:MAG: 1-deoxy-D-xylulose-5-phosphate synthase [Lachnospiraceae bacterium]|nr:1-deoxy-D-xylulose-5-phosphate synthase [Lachnospiraceae bacterium]
MRAFLVDKVSRTGGHVSSNLGMVELTMALFRSFDFPKDKIIFDVGHQAYTYKLLSGRESGFDSLRQLNGMSGFPKCAESEYDCFDTGHSSTSVSAGLGLVRARDLKKEDYYVISIIGDGSMTGGEAYEALNNAALLKTNFIIILNDNNMSISGNVGGLRNYLATLRSGKGYNRMKAGVKQSLGGTRVGDKVVQAIGNAMDSVKELVLPSGMLFENLGLTYFGPVDGHNIAAMEKILKRAKELPQPVLIHVLTRKGKGYKPAELHPSKFHGIGPFDVETGKERKSSDEKTYSELFGSFLTEAAAKDERIVAVTAAMGRSVGLIPFSKKYPDRYFDVGIAEQHAVTFSAGLAKGGLHPYAAIFSSFLQRGYDQLVHDVCMQNLPVVFAVDRAGLVGQDGETHQGAFDISYLTPVPNLTVLAPKDGPELLSMLNYTRNAAGPVAVRYPRGTAKTIDTERDCPIETGKAEILRRGTGIALLAFGDLVKEALGAEEILREHGLSPTVVNMRFIKPWDRELVRSLEKDHPLLVTLEDGVINGGIGERIAAEVTREGGNARVISLGLPDRFIPQGCVSELLKTCGLDAGSVADLILKETDS